MIAKLGRARGKCPVCWERSKSASLVCICKSSQLGAELSHTGFPPDSDTEGSVEILAKLGLIPCCRQSCHSWVLTCQALSQKPYDFLLAAESMKRYQCSVRKLHTWNDLYVQQRLHKYATCTKQKYRKLSCALAHLGEQWNKGWNHQTPWKNQIYTGNVIWSNFNNLSKKKGPSQSPAGSLRSACI